MIHNYSALAPLYDKIMAHVEYDEWVAYIKKIFSSYASTDTPFVFEIGGGTGLLGGKLVREGFRYQGSDLSTTMCSQARARGLPFFAADVRFLPVKKTECFDAVIFLYDGINYLQSLDEYLQAFTGVHALLKPQGLFLFDVTTTANSLKNFSDFVDAGDFDEHFYFRRSYYRRHESMQYNDFTIFTKRTMESSPSNATWLYQKGAEHHAQKVLPISTIKEAVPRSLFDIIGMWDNFSFQRYSAQSERVHFLLKKAAG
jgi:SAM-dependent methyltransferase